MKPIAPFILPLVLSLMLATANAVAQTAPIPRDPADQLLREQRAREQLERAQQRTPRIAGADRTEAIDPGTPVEAVAEIEPAFDIQRIIVKGLAGTPILGERRLAAVIEPFQGKRLGQNRINLLLRRLTGAMLEDGWITTRAYLGAQNLAAGTLEITVVPGRIERFQVGGVDLDAGDATGRAILTAMPARSGDFLRLADLEQGVDQLNRLRRNRAELQILPGQSPGGSTVNVTNTPGDRAYFNFGADNYGSRITGSTRYRIGVDVNDALGYVEAFGVTYVGSVDSNAILASFAMPYGYNAFSYTYSYSEFQNLIADTALVYGRTHGHNFGWNRVLARSREGRIGMDVVLALRNSAREINGVALTAQDLAVLRIAANALRRIETAATSGFLSIEAGYSRGLDALGANRDANDLTREAAHAQFSKLDLTLGAGVQWPGGFSYRGQIVSQWTQDALYASEQIYAGGAATVRGFPESATAADRGYFTRHDRIPKRVRTARAPGSIRALRIRRCRAHPNDRRSAVGHARRGRCRAAARRPFVFTRPGGG